MGVIVYFALQDKDISEADDHCPLASCPTASGIVVDR